MTISTILVDMDGVLVDFVSAALKRHGVTFDQIEPHWVKGPEGWDLWKPVCEVKQIPYEGFGHQFWKPIHRDADFWSNLQQYSWTDELIRHIEHVCPNWHISTSPSQCPSSYAGKIASFQKMFPHRALSYLHLNPNKFMKAKPGVVLIDDSDANCNKFKSAGGHAVLFPQRWNTLHEVTTPQGKLDHVFHALGSIERC